MKKETREALKILTEKVMTKKNLKSGQRPQVSTIIYEEFRWFNTKLKLSEQDALINVRNQMGVR